MIINTKFNVGDFVTVDKKEIYIVDSITISKDVDIMYRLITIDDQSENTAIESELIQVEFA